MSQGVHVIAGYGPIDDRSYVYSGVSGRVVSVSHSGRNRGVHLVANVRRYRASSVVCRSGGHRRNPDFSRHNRQGTSRSRKRQNEEKDSFDHLDDSEMLASKNGPLLSLSNTPKFQATAAPGPKEKEIVELFRKVQAQLREKAAAKEEKKVEASQGKGKESETVDSLLKLLRKHSIEQGKRKVGTDGNGDFTREQPEKSRQPVEGQSKILYNRRKKVENAIPKPSARALSRPQSNFRRRSPVPQVLSLYANEEAVNSTYGSSKHLNQFETQTKSTQQPDLDLEIEADGDADLELESELEPEATFAEADAIDELSDDEASDVDDITEDREKQQETEIVDLSLLKLPELRALAKSRGVKGYSKMKKADLVDLLTGDSI